jgi:hypothetical protein
VEMVLSGPRKGSCHQVTAHIEEIKPSEAINVVSEFPYVFPEELPCMPTKRKVEFAIELVPGTAPFSKRAYRVSRPELVELKKQIDELLEKGYIRQVPRLRQPQCYLWRRKMVQRGCALITDL